MLDETASWPIDSYLISAPCYLRPSQRGLLAHFTALAGHASWPIVLYNVPYRTSVNIETEMLLRLARHPNIIGLKDCSADRAQSIDLLRRRPEDFRVLIGEDATRSATAPMAPSCCRPMSRPQSSRVCRPVFVQATATPASACWDAVGELTRLLFAEPSPAPAKYWLARRGMIASAEVRSPMAEVSTELATRLDQEIARRSSMRRELGLVNAG